MQKHIPAAAVHGQKRPRMSDMSLGFPCRENAAPWGKVHGSQKHPLQANCKAVLQHLCASVGLG